MFETIKEAFRRETPEEAAALNEKLNEPKKIKEFFSPENTQKRHDDLQNLLQADARERQKSLNAALSQADTAQHEAAQQQAALERELDKQYTEAEKEIREIKEARIERSGTLKERQQLSQQRLDKKHSESLALIEEFKKKRGGKMKNM